VLAALFASLTSAVLVLDAGTLDQFRFWMVGSIAGRDFGVVRSVAPFIAAGLVLALLSGPRLNALALGDEVAGSLGQRVQLARAGIALGFVLLAGGAVAAAGPTAFVGLVCPHLARALVGADYRWIVPFSALLGASLLLSSDIVGRVVARPGELEVGIVTAALGAPLFVWFVRRGRLIHA
jgi:iron complex transport system permease protein